MDTTKPTVLFVHGSWHEPAHFKPVSEVFNAAGYATVCPRHASNGQGPSADGTWLSKDTEVVREAATNLVNEGKDVVVVMHSYGGIIGTEAIHENLGKKARSAKGEKGGVTNLVYMCAFVPPEKQSLASTFGGQLPPYVIFRDDGTCWMEEPEERFFNGLSDSDKKKYKDLLKPVPEETQFTPTTYSAYKYFPTTYLYCTNDQALPLGAQQMMVNKVESEGASFQTITCDAGHSPYLSHPETVLSVVEGLKA